jgi:signal transduction histidine kinase
MKKIIPVLISFCCFTLICLGQDKQIDSLFQVLKTSKDDTTKVNTLNRLSGKIKNTDPDTANYFAGEAQALAMKLNYKVGLADSYLNMGAALMILGDNEKAVANCNNALTLYEQILTAPGGFEKKDDTSKILRQKAGAYNVIGLINYHQGNNAEALKNYLISLKICEEIGDKQGIANATSNMGLIYRVNGNYQEALNHYLAALKIYEEIGNKQGISRSYLTIGGLYQFQGNYPEAVKNDLASLKISDEIGDKQASATCYNNIAMIYNDQGNYTDAILNFYLSLKIREEIGDKQGISDSYMNIGSCYDDHGNSREALRNYSIALKIKEEIGDKQGIADCYINIGSCYDENGNQTGALKNYFIALKIREETGDKEGIAFCYNTIGALYTKQKKNDEAYLYLNKGLSLVKEIGNLKDISQGYSVLAVLDSLDGNFKKSLEHYKMYIATRDSMVNQETTKKITQVQMQYEFDKKETQAKQEQEEKDTLNLKELQRQKLIRDFALGTIGLVLILFFFIYRSYRARQALRLNDIRNRIASDLHDDIGSTLNSISIYSEVAKKKDEDHDEALEMIGDASRKIIDAMSDIVWTINADNDSFEKIIFRMKSLAYNLFRAKKIEFTFHSDEILNEKKLSLEERRNFYLIFKESINNLVKYSNATRVAITLTSGNNRIRLRIRDNGIGFNTLQENTGNGLKNMKRRADEMKAKFMIESQPGNGTQIELILKV